jgi:hypothetical protein
MTLAQLRRHVSTWQRRLRVSDWKISVAWGTMAEMDACGLTLYDPRGMTAEMTIAQDMEDAAYEDGGIEQTVIHELLHVVMHGDQEYRGEKIMQERAINQIADALYRAYRRKRKGE